VSWLWESITAIYMQKGRIKSRSKWNGEPNSENQRGFLGEGRNRVRKPYGTLETQQSDTLKVRKANPSKRQPR